MPPSSLVFHILKAFGFSFVNVDDIRSLNKTISLTVMSLSPTKAYFWGTSSDQVWGGLVLVLVVSACGALLGRHRWRGSLSCRLWMPGVRDVVRNFVVVTVDGVGRGVVRRVVAALVWHVVVAPPTSPAPAEQAGYPEPVVGLERAVRLSDVMEWFYAGM